MLDLRKAFQLRDPRKLGLFLKVLVSIPVLRLLLAGMKIPRLLESLDRASRKREPFGPPELEWARLAWKYVNFLLLTCLKVQRPCLLRSLVLFRLFRKAGLQAKIHMGVKRNGPLLEGHSWLSLNGDLLLEENDPQMTYTRTYSYPDEGNQFRSTDPNN